VGDRVRQVRAASLAGDIVLDGGNAGERVTDRTIAGAAAQVAFEGMWQVRPLLLVEHCRRHDHAGGAIAALERLRIEEGALDRMQRAVSRQSFDRGHLSPGGAEGRHPAGMKWCAVYPYLAGAGSRRGASFNGAKGTEVGKKGPAALAGLRSGPEQVARGGLVSAAGGFGLPNWGGILAHAVAPGCASSAR